MFRTSRSAAWWVPVAVTAAAVGVVLATSPAGAAGQPAQTGAAEPATARVLTTPAPDTVPPTQPGPIQIAEIGNTRIRLTWTASTDNVAVVQYDVTQVFSDVVMQRPTPINEITFSGLQPSRRYSFSVTARDAAGNRSSDVSLTVIMPPGDDQPPSAPADLTASSVTDTTVRLTWRPSTDNVVLQYYEVVQITSEGTRTVAIVWQQPPAAPSNSTTIRGLTPNTSYTYAMRALDEVGNASEFSPPLTVTTRGPDTGPGTCVVTYRIMSQWNTGFQAEVTVRNEGPAPIDGWELAWTFPAGQHIAYGWGAVLVDQTGPDVLVRNQSWNRRIEPGGSVWLGFVGTWSGSNPVPANFALNGGPCGAGG